MKTIQIKIKLLLAVVLMMVISSCKNGSQTKEATTSTTADSTASQTAAPKMNYVYTIEHPDNWDIGSSQNTANVLNALKAWENNNLDESVKYFADSVRVQFDGMDKTVSRDSLKALITPPPGVKAHSVKMQDWESVISKDKKDEYVTLWYREYNENSAGKKDSIDVINDLKMKDGKIIGLDQYTRKLH